MNYIYILIYAAIFAAFGVGEYFYLSSQKLVTNKKLIIYLSVMQVLLVAGFSHRFPHMVFDATCIKTIKYALLLQCAAVVAVTDWVKKIIPNKVLLVALLCRCILIVVEFLVFKKDSFAIYKGNLAACLLPLVILILGLFIMKNSIGMGDIKLLFIIGLYTDFQFMFNSLFISLIVAMIVAIFMLATKKMKVKQELAFAPFLLIGLFVAVVVGI